MRYPRLLQGLRDLARKPLRDLALPFVASGAAAGVTGVIIGRILDAGHFSNLAVKNLLICITGGLTALLAGAYFVEKFENLEGKNEEEIHRPSPICSQREDRSDAAGDKQ